MRYQAILFDMDGVLVDSEREWLRSGAAFLNRLYGEDIRRQIGETVGLSVDAEYELAANLGFAMDRDAFYAAYDRQAALIYAASATTDGVSDVLEALAGLGFSIGLVTSSRRSWVDMALSRITARDRFDYVLALGERRDLRSKPHPDGYLTAVREMGTEPERTIVVEDSNNGIRAAKAAGALVVGYRGNLLPDYQQVGADLYAADMADVLRIAGSLV